MKRTSKVRWVGFVLWAMVTVSPPVMAQARQTEKAEKAEKPASPPLAVEKTPGAEFPATPVGESARALIAAVNSGDEARRVSFVKKHVSDALGMGWTQAKYTNLLRKLWEQSGGLDVVHVSQIGENSLGMFMNTRKGGRQLAIECSTDNSPKTPNAAKLVYIGMHPQNAPVATSWPEGKQAPDAIAAAVKRHVAAAQAADRFSGAVLVAKEGRVLVHEVVGQADREKKIANTPKTRFQTASVGKMFTGVAVGQLVEKGRLSFDDTVAKVLPFYPNPAARKITVHQLLTHTSGVPDLFDSPRFDWAKQYRTPSDYFPVFADQPLAFSPGARHEYSNSNYAILAAIVEKVTGQKYADYVQQHIFRVAGMSAAEPAKWGATPWAFGYSHDPETDPLGMETRTRPALFSRSKDDGRGGFGGFGGLHLTADDLFRFCRALRENKLVGAAMNETLTKGKVAIGPNTPIRYGYGFMDIPMNEVSMRGHSGGGGNSGNGAHVEMLWENGYTLIVIGNYDLEDIRPLTVQIASFLTRQ